VLNARGECATIHRAYSTGIAWNMVHGDEPACCCCALPTADFSQEVKRGGIHGLKRILDLQEHEKHLL